MTIFPIEILLEYQLWLMDNTINPPWWNNAVSDEESSGDRKEAP